MAANTQKLTFSLLIGAAVSAVALYFAFRRVDFAELRIYLEQVAYIWILPSILLIVLVMVLRALRWRLIVTASHDIGFWQAFHPLNIAFMINCILPGRVGEVARPVILKTNDDIPFTFGLATVALERFFDMVSLLLLLAAVMFHVNIDPGLDMRFGDLHLNKAALEQIGQGMLLLCLILIGGIALLSVQRTRTLCQRLLMGLANLLYPKASPRKDRFSQKFVMPLVTIMENVAGGFTLMRSPMRILGCSAYSFAIWLTGGLSYYLVSLGCPDIPLSYFDITASMIIVCFFIALPSVPGYWGLWEAGGVFALSLFGIPASQALGFTLLNHVIQIFPIIVIGLLSAILTGINIVEVSYNKQPAAAVKS